MFPVADDFAAIAKRMKEIQAEMAAETAAAEARHSSEDERQPRSPEFSEDNAYARSAGSVARQ
jgi:hypothetical protein